MAGLSVSLLIVEYYRVKEKLYWKEQAELSKGITI